MLTPELHRLPLPGWAAHWRREADRSEFVWVLGLMRSGSTLLCHLLVNHQEIAGFGESWVRYRSSSDLAELVLRVRLYGALERLRAGKVPEQPTRRVLDKLLYDPLLPNVELLGDPRIKVILLLRDPRDVMTSLLTASIPFPHGRSAETAGRYCERRFAAFERYANALGDPKRVRLVDYEALTQRSSETLRGLGDFLGLEAPLTESYRLHLATGVPGLGDPTRLIRSGRIVRDRSKTRLDLPEAVVERSLAAYHHCCEQLSRLGVVRAGASAGSSTDSAPRM